VTAPKPARVGAGLALGLLLASLAVYWLIPHHSEAPAMDELREAPREIAVAPRPATPEREQAQDFEISNPVVPAATPVPVQADGQLSLRWADPLPSRGVAEGLEASLAWMPCRDGETVRPATHLAYLSSPCWTGPAAERLIWTGDVPPGDVEWRVSHLGFEVARGRFVQRVSSGELVLDASGWPSLVVAIRDANGKVPPRATLTLGVSRGEATKSCSTDCDAGEAVFAPLSPQCVYSLRVEAEGFTPFYSSDLAFAPGVHRQRVEAVLQRPASVAGTVVDEADKAVAACEVKLRTFRNEQSQTTDEAGRFHFEGATAGPARVSVKSADRPEVSRTIVLAPDAPPLLLRLPQAAWLEGALVDSAGTSLGGHQPVLGYQEQADETERSSSRFTETDADGRFRLGPFAEGRPISIIHALTGASITVNLGQAATLQVPTKTVKGYQLLLRDVAGQPLPGPVEARIGSATLSTGGKHSVAADGLLQLKGFVLDGQPATLRLQKDGFEDFVLELPSTGTETLTCTLVARGSDPFRVVCQEASGQPLEGVSLRLRREQRQRDLVPDDVGRIVADGVGRPGLLQRFAMTEKDGAASLRIGEWPATTIVATAAGFYPTLMGLSVEPVEPVRIVLRRVED
jgi:hypothetical protein